MNFKIKNTFTTLPSDPIKDNHRRQVYNACYSYVYPKKTAHPQMIHISKEMAQELGLNEEDLRSEEFLMTFTGNNVMENTEPFAMCYGGHQFGQWAGQLGDGRAINLFEIENNNKQWAVQLKGAGETPYSRSADGLAVLRSSVREYLCSEAMFHLGVPTTRALSLALSGDKVLRDIMYDGNSENEKGAIVCRVAETFIRFGNFEILAANQDHDTLKKLVDYTIAQFFPHLDSLSKETYLQFFEEVCQLNLEMVIHWQRVGFVHGVMNTDNMSILGLTIDYGPYGWLEGYDFGWTPNTTDNQFKRYRYGTQGEIIGWNLYKLANAIYPLIGEAEGLQDILEKYQNNYHNKYLNMMAQKIGLSYIDDGDKSLIEQLEKNLHLTETDMTIFFRNLSKLEKENNKGIEIIKDAFYKPDDIQGEILNKWNNWFESYHHRLVKETVPDSERQQKMNLINPKYVLRNYMAQMAIDNANKDDYQLIDELYQLLKKPYDEQKEQEKWFAKRPEWARHKVGCSMLSCSS